MADEKKNNEAINLGSVSAEKLRAYNESIGNWNEHNLPGLGKAVHAEFEKTQKNLPRIFKAVFKGLDGSLEFRTGKTYEVYIIGKKGNFITVQRVSDNVGCPYESIEAFFNNWDNIRLVKNHDAVH